MEEQNMMEEIEQQELTYTLPYSAIAEFERELERINKKALSYGVPAITYEVLGIVEKQPRGKKEKLPCKIIKINQPEEVRINGWKLVAKKEKNATDEFIIHQFGERIPEEIKEITTCQHCDIKRKRRHFYILQNENSEYKTVGKSCLKEFIGDDSAERVARNLEYLYLRLDEAEYNPDKEYFGTSAPIFYPVRDIVRFSAYSIKKLGRYRGRYSAGLSTIEDVYNTMFGNREVNKKERAEALETITEEEIDMYINAVLESEDIDNQFIQNLKVLINEEYVKTDLMGLAVAIPTVVERQKWKAEKEKEKAEIKETDYVGEIGEVLETQVKYEKEITFDGFYGTTYMYFFKDENDNVIVWKTTTGKDFKEDKTYKVKGKVKEHKEFRNVKQTFLNRPKFTEEG